VAKSYEVDPKNVQALLPAVAREILEAMNAQVTLEEKSRLSSSRETTPEAYEAYMRGCITRERERTQTGPRLMNSLRSN